MSNQIKEMRERQARIVAEARERNDQITDKTDAARVSELEAAHDAAMAEYDRLESMIAREEKVAELERREAGRQTEERERRRYKPSDRTEESPAAGEGVSPTYRSAFAKFACGLDLEPEERAILKSGKEHSETRAQTAGTNAAGGYTVPTELANLIVKSMVAYGPMYSGAIATEIVTSGGNSIKLPTVNDTGVAAVAHTEGTALTDDGGSDVTFGQKSLDAYGFDTEFVRWSWELENDSIFNMEAFLAELLSERLGRIANAQLTTGTGSSAPNGVVTASSAGKTAAATAAITGDEIIDLIHSVDPAHRAAPKTAFMFNDSTLAAIRKLKDGDGNYLWQMGDVQQGIPGTLLGYRFHVNQAMDSLAAAKKVILFGDFGKYFVRKVGKPVMGVMRERFWPDLGIAGLIRFDGELADTAAVKHLITAAS